MAKKKIKKTTVKKRIDKLWSSIVRGNGKCEVCGSTEYLNAHHIIGRKLLKLRWDLRNGCCLCSGCHTFRNYSAHQNPVWFDEWLQENRPEDLKYLKEKYKEPSKPYSVQELLEIEIEIKKLV